MMKKVVMYLLILAMLVSMIGCTTADQPETQATQDTQETTPEAYGAYQLDADRNELIVDDVGKVSVVNNGNARLFYHIFVGSFSDSNGDGVGDLRGIINRFDYLNNGDPNSGLSLGVEGIWLSPIFRSPSYHKYDASDYYEIDPKFGTMEDLQELIELCHSRNVKLILDLVINHSSDDHPWFQAFVDAHQRGDTENEYYDFYSWSETNAAGATWYGIRGTGHYFEGNFSGDMPEMNFDNPAVRQTAVDLAKFYLDMGVDGFRFDAAKYIYYGNEALNAEFWQWYMGELRSIKPDIYTVAEVWDADPFTYPYFASTNCFNFSMSQSSGKIATAAKGGNVNALFSYVQQYLEAIRAQNADAMMVTFIANHDMDRTAGFLTVESGHAYMAANLSILMPGSTFVYYGEEIGMLGSRGGSSTDANRRLAMPWGDGDTVKDPIGAHYPTGQKNGTVAEQLCSSTSLYTHYKRLIAIRRANPEIAYGEMTPLKTSGKAGGFLCTYKGSTVAVLHNTTTEPVTIDLTALDCDVLLTQLVAHAGLGTATLEGTILTLAPQTSAVLK